MALFRNIRLEDDHPALPDTIEVIYYDDQELSWISWPTKNQEDMSQASHSLPGHRDPCELSGSLEELKVELFHAVSLNERDRSFEQYRSKKNFTHALIDTSEEGVPPALLPEASSLKELSLLIPDLERAGLGLLAFQRLVSLSILKDQEAFKFANRLPKGTVVFGFERRHLMVTGVNNAWQLFVEPRIPRNLDFENATEPSTFQQMVERLDLHVFDSISRIVDNEQQHATGASFNVAVGRAKEKSNFDPYTSGAPRQQWTRGSILVFKRPAFQSSPDRSNWGSSQAGVTKTSNQSARVERSVINELQILSHPPLRNHPNIVHLYGICWDRTNASSVYDASPILVQSFADHGQLDSYLRYMRESSGVSDHLKASILMQILAGLRDLHSCRIIHGDIKPDNILVQSRGGNENPRIMLSDFGFSLMTRPDQDEVRLAGQTKAYAAPEVFRCIREGKTSISTAEAFASDVYSFGMTAFCIVTDDENMFRTMANLWTTSTAEIDLVNFLPRLPTSDGEPMTAEQLSIEAKTTPQSDDWFLPHVHALLYYETLNKETALSWTWIASALYWSSKERPKVHHLISYLEESAGLLPSPPLNELTGSISHELGQKLQRIFLVDGVLLEFGINDLEDRLHEDLMTCSFRVKEQLFDDLRFKSRVLIDNPVDDWSALRNSRGLQKWTASVYAAYQVFLCFLNGFGTRQDRTLAGRYLAASACGGYAQALTMCVRFHEKHPDIELPGWKPDVPSIYKLLSVGFFPGIQWFNLDLQILKELDPEKAAQVWLDINQYGLIELGEDQIENPPHHETCYPGPDIQFLWYPEGSIDLFGSLLPRSATEHLINGFKTGLFPEDRTNYRGESALYMSCRMGNAELVLALFEEFDWVQQQTITATHNGRLPLHFLFAFPSDDFLMVGEILLAHGAQIHATDKKSWRAVDFAISAGREDVAFWLLDHQKMQLFEDDKFRDTDLLTATLAASSGSTQLLQRCLQNAAIETKIDVLNKGIAVQPVEINILRKRPENIDYLVNSIGRVSEPEFRRLQDQLSKAMIAAALRSNTDVLSSIVECVLPEKNFDNKSLVYILAAAAINGHEEDVKVILQIPAAWTVRDAHDILSTIVEQCPSASQYKIVETLLQHFDAINIAKETVNFLPTGCKPCCNLHSSHSYPPSLFASAILGDHYDIARLLSDHVVHNDGYPSALYHVLTRPSARTLDHINELIALGEEFWQYVCYPIYERTALQVVTKLNGDYKSPEDVANVLHLLLEYYVDAGEDIDAVDNLGCSALYYAADFSCPEAVEVLQQYGADPLLRCHVRPFLHVQDFMSPGSDFVLNQQRIEMVYTAYEWVLYQFYNNLMATQRPRYKLDRSKFHIPSVPMMSDADDAQRQGFVKQFRALAALSYEVENASEIPARFGAEDVAGGDLSMWKVQGFIPRTQLARVELVIAPDGTPQLEVWGVYSAGHRQLSIWIGLKDNDNIDYMEEKRRLHKARYAPDDPESLVVYAVTAYDTEGRVYLFLVEQIPSDENDDAGLLSMEKEATIDDPDWEKNMEDAMKRLETDSNPKGKGKAKE